MRPYELPEFDREFVEREFRDANRSTRAPSGPIDVPLDIDATPRGLVDRILYLIFPPTITTDITVRAEALSPETRHIYTLVYLARVGFLVGISTLSLIWMMRAAPTFMQGLMGPLIFQCVASVVLHFLFTRAWADVALWILFAAVILFFIGGLANQDLLPLLAQMIIHSLILLIVTRQTPAATLRRSVMVVSCYLLAIRVGNPGEFTHGILLPAAASIAVSTFVPFVLVRNVVLWMAANRATSAETISFYEKPDEADPELQIARRRSVYLLVSAFATSVLWAAALVLFCIGFSDAINLPEQQVYLAIAYVAVLLAIHGLNWVAAELLFHHRIPRPSSCLRSFYISWRALTAWIAYTPALSSPTVFAFPRPWSCTWLRLLLIRVSILAMGAIPIGVGWDWVATCVYVPPAPAPMSPEQRVEPSMIPPGTILTPTGARQAYRASHGSFQTAETIETQRPSALPGPEVSQTPVGPRHRLTINPLDFRFWLLFAAYVSLCPAALFTLAVAAIWGPTLTAAHDRFELRDESSTIPILTWRFGRTEASSRQVTHEGDAER